MPSPQPSPQVAPTISLKASVLSDDYIRGQEFEAQGKVEEAVSAYRTAVARDPADKESWKALAIIYDRNGDTDYAATCYRKILALSPGDEAATRWLAAHPSPVPSESIRFKVLPDE